jgi:hypothetical protein
MRFLFFIIILWFIINGLLSNHCIAAKDVKTGTIKGIVLNAETRSPLAGANISVMHSRMGAASDVDGYFTITGIPVGTYLLQFEYIGYQTLTKTDIIVRPKRITFVQAKLNPANIESEEIVVHAGYFEEEKEQPTSAIEFSGEEIRRAPGSAGDVSRILMILPGIAKVNDQSNNLIVRGGNPFENTFFIDNIEIPNINHFPSQGASGGPIGMLNVDFIQDVSFYSGGFSAEYGDKLSSVMDIKFRDGNRSEFDGQLDLNFTGFDGVLESPISDKGSWLFSIRRSYLDFVVDLFDVGSTVAPSYGDIQGKMIYEINPSNKLILLGIFADDHNSPDRKTAEENYMMHYGNQDLYQGTIGANLRTIWKSTGYSNNSIAMTSNKYNENFYETTTGRYAIRNRSAERTSKFRSVNHFRLNSNNSIEFGLEGKYLWNNYDNYYSATTNLLGDTIPSLKIGNKISADKAGSFISYIYSPLSQITAIMGIRADYFSFNEEVNFSPRFSLTYRMSPKFSLNGSAGIYYQSLPLLLLSQNNLNTNLNNPKAVHYILGTDYLLTDNTKLTLEIYQKNYENFPMDIQQPSLFVMDKSYFVYYEHLVSKGIALSRGIELTLQKKLAVNFYGLLSASWFRSRYKGLDGVWRNRDYDNRITFSLEGGYKPDHNWEFSIRWIFAGGVPYTPADLNASVQNHRLVNDRDKINAQRYPDYHSMNIRLDKRYNFKHSNITAYISVWNVYNRKNVANYFWNDKDQKVDEVYQWGLLPIFGLEYEF